MRLLLADYSHLLYVCWYFLVFKIALKSINIQIRNFLTLNYSQTEICVKSILYIVTIINMHVVILVFIDYFDTMGSNIEVEYVFFY